MIGLRLSPLGVAERERRNEPEQTYVLESDYEEVCYLLALIAPEWRDDRCGPPEVTEIYERIERAIGTQILESVAAAIWQARK